MPLAHECIERAQERSPSLKGMLALSIETISDEQLGAVVDVAEAAPNNCYHAASLMAVSCRLSDVHQRLQWGRPAVMAIGDARG